MKRFAVMLSICSVPVALPAIEVSDTFETGGNPNQWGWLNSMGSFYTLQPTGGNRTDGSTAERPISPTTRI